MKLEPSVMVLYVEDMAIASPFYQDLLGIKPEEDSATFHGFKLANGMLLALKAKHTVLPAAEQKSGNSELAFTVESQQKVDVLFAEWQAKNITIIFPPAQVPFGYTFVALDPDGNRLRIVALGNS